MLSRVTLRLLTCGDKGTGNQSMMMGGAWVCCDSVRVDLEVMCRASVLLPLNLEEVPAHPAPDVFHAGNEGGRKDGGGGFGGDVDLCVIGIAVKVDPMMMEDCAQGEEVDDEEEWTQD